MHRAIALAALMLASPASADTLYVHAGRLIDPESGQVLTDRAIRVEQGKVTAVTAWTAPPPGAHGPGW